MIPWRIRLATQRKRLPKNIIHGLSAYNNWRCRCKICRAARKKYDEDRKYRGAKPYKGKNGK